MFEAVYIADSKTNLIFEYLISLSSPHFNSLKNIIRLKQHDTGASSDSTPVIPLIELNPEYFVCCHQTNNLVIYLLCFKSEKTSFNPILPFVLINRLIEVMEDYFGTPLSNTKIVANNDTLTLLINDMIDDGIPNVTDPNKLKDSIPFKSLLSKFLSTGNDLAMAASKSSINSLTHNTRNVSSPHSSDADVIPWRRSNVKYTNNEMYVDVVETINVILKPSTKKSATHNQEDLFSTKKYGSAFYSPSSFTNSQSRLTPVVGSINGEVNFLSHLTGVPYLQMLLNVRGLQIELPQFHPCIKLENWNEQEGNLSFIPPDGNSTLMTYQVDFDNFDKKAQQEMLGLLDIDYQTELGSNKNEFELRVSLKQHKSSVKLENITIEINSFQSSSNSDPSLDHASTQHGSPHDNDNSRGEIVNIKGNRVTHGDFQYKGNGRGEWNLRNLVSGVQPILRGSLITADSEEFLKSSSSSPSLHEDQNLLEIENSTHGPAAIKKAIKPSFLRVSYSNKGSVPSGLKVDSLKILSAKGLGETVKPYKGVKYTTKTGDYIVRS